ncbi:MAG: hypothetical protein A2139_11950 [Desulfobacca sp. RBG_16_60_12]|nr:MAG: hypothetical protein A2139_11950 [Desulfobacca sp. RBG_16_60_12]
MATYTSTQNGNWNDSATWGGGGYPVAAGDIANIGHIVTYNVVSTVELGQITINNGGILTFLNSMSTKLTLGAADITINNGGELRVGASGAIIPKTYLAELIWNTISDNAKGINIANGGKLTVYGDPDYFGSDYDSVLVSQAVIPAAGNSVTITITGDFTTKWIAGQELLVHSGGAYSNYTNDFCRLAITSVSANGSNTDVACTVIERLAGLTCLVGADVLHLTRNVKLYKYNYNANLSQANNNRPRITNANAVGTANVNMSDVSVAGFYAAGDGYGISFNGVVRNCGFPFVSAYLSTINGIICMFNGPSSNLLNNCVVNAWQANSANSPIGGYNVQLGGNILGFGVGAIYQINGVVSANIYSNSVGIYNNIYDTIVTGNIGYDGYGVQKNNTNDFSLQRGRFTVRVVNSIIHSVPTFANRNTLTYNSRIRFEHFLQTAGAHYVADAFGDIYEVAADGSGDNPSQRSGGGADVIEVIPQSNCAPVSYLELLNIRLWATAGVNKSYRFYLQTDYAALAKNGLVLYGQYLDQGSGGHLGPVNSSTSGNFTTRSNQSDWSQYVEVAINPAQDGYVNLYIRLMGYETSKKVWVDPKVAITGGDAVTVTPRWSYGEVQLDIDPVTTGGGGSSPPINSGLLPLGVMEVVV